jgi:predicted small lipoprotein YifL
MRWVLLVALSFSVATCGQKGPLELPETQVRAAVPLESIQ